METCKKTLGRRKIEIKKIDKKTSLQVAFAKRRRGLFRKASELAVLCGVEVAILVQSPAQKLFTFGHPSVEAIINRASLSPEAAGRIVRGCHEGRRKLEEATKMLEMEKRRAAEKEMTRSGGGFWWEESFEGLELHELEEYLKALECLEGNVSERLMKISSAPSSSSLQDFCSTFEPIQDFNFEPIPDFCCNFAPIPDFCNPSSIQELGDESSLNPYAMMMENCYGLDFLN